jgi:hypothetical protein
VAGERHLVRDRTPDRPTPDDRDIVRAFTHFPIFLIPTATSEIVVTFDLVFAAALWAVVAAIAVANGGQLSRQQAYRS